MPAIVVGFMESPHDLSKLHETWGRPTYEGQLDDGGMCEVVGASGGGRFISRNPDASRCCGRAAIVTASTRPDRPSDRSVPSTPTQPASSGIEPDGIKGIPLRRLSAPRPFSLMLGQACRFSTMQGMLETRTLYFAFNKCMAERGWPLFYNRFHRCRCRDGPRAR
jgi:hypothetical protein